MLRPLLGLLLAGVFVALDVDAAAAQSCATTAHGPANDPGAGQVPAVQATHLTAGGAVTCSPQQTVSNAFTTSLDLGFGVTTFEHVLFVALPDSEGPGDPLVFDRAVVAGYGPTGGVSSPQTAVTITCPGATAATSGTPGRVQLAVGTSCALTATWGAATFTATLSRQVDGYAISAGTFTIGPVAEIDVQGNSVSISDGDTTPSIADHTDFGSTNVTGGTVTRTFTIRNTGTAPLALTGASPVTITGANSGDFTVVAQPSGPVAANGSVTFDVTFDPSAPGTRTATINIASNDADENPHDFAIEGFGSNPSFSVTKIPSPTSVNAAGTTINYAIIMTNTGDVTLSIAGIDDPLTSDEACPLLFLPAGDTMICTASYTVQQSDIDNNGIDANGNADGDGDIDNTVTITTEEAPAQSASAVVSIGGASMLTAVKSVAEDRYSRVGDVLNYQFVITNTSGVALTGLSINDPLTLNESCPVTTLAPGASTTCTASYTVVFADLQNRVVTNTATVDTDQTAPLSTNTVRVEFDPTYVQTRTQRVIANFLNRRADHITANEPELASRLTDCGGARARLGSMSLNGTADSTQAAFSTSLSQLGAWMKNDRRHDDPSVGFTSNSAADSVASTDTVAAWHTGAEPRPTEGAATSSPGSSAFGAFSGMAALGGPTDDPGDVGAHGRHACSPLDLWLQATWSHSNSDTADNHLGLLFMGADYRLSDDLLVGLLAQFDSTKETDDVEAIMARGHGWLFGPYIVARLTDNLLFDGRVAWGRSSNEVDPLGGYYTDDFDTERWLLRARLTGDFSMGAWHFAPHVGVVYFEEEQKAYTDSLNIAIPGQTISLGRVTFGPRIGYHTVLWDGTSFAPFIGIKGIWDFDEAEIVDLETGASSGTSDDLRARVEAGLILQAWNGWSLRGEGFYDGIGADKLEAYGASLRLNVPLN